MHSVDPTRFDAANLATVLGLGQRCSQVFRPMLMIALEQYYQAQVPEVLQSLFEALNNADIAGAPRPTPWERGLMRRCGGMIFSRAGSSGSRLA